MPDITTDPHWVQFADMVADRVCQRQTLPPAFMTPAQTASYLRVSKELLQKWRRLGEGPPYVIVGNRPRYRTADIEKFAANLPEARR